jgi:hypothetical protein
MPHTITQNRRSKRPDSRPNKKFRVKVAKKESEKMKISDIRVTSIGSKSKKEREVSTATELRKEGALNKDEKLLRALKKKLYGIKALQEKKKNGEALDEQQREKLSQLDEVLVAMDELIKRGVGVEKE